MCIVGGGFVVTEAQAQAFELSEGAVTAKLVRPFVNGNDVTKKAPQRNSWVERGSDGSLVSEVTAR